MRCFWCGHRVFEQYGAEWKNITPPPDKVHFCGGCGAVWLQYDEDDGEIFIDVNRKPGSVSIDQWVKEQMESLPKAD